jgi:hypothetical protein
MYIKWLGTSAIILAAIARVMNFHHVDLWLTLAGAALWGIAALLQEDYALLTVNSFIMIITFIGVFYG